MSDLTEPLHGLAGDEMRDLVAATAPVLSPWHDLLAAIVDHLDVPLPAEYDLSLKYLSLLESRVAQLRGYLGGMVEQQHESTFHAQGIRGLTAGTPVTYTPYTAPEDRQTEIVEAGR
ncbi:hypothetical protein ACFV85_14860 [Streptomyces niveus]|uniref:hypothetical protein n=1 Tax=Streptomyces niveus TaxID=193462 RepID=UPI00365CCDC7